MEERFSYFNPDEIYKVDGIHILGKDLTKEQEEIISKEIEKQMLDDYCKSMEDYQDECDRINERILKAIRSVNGDKFAEAVLAFVKSQFEEGVDIEGGWKLTKRKHGDYQKEDWVSFKGIWVDQWSVGDSGDSWNGHIFIKLRKDKYLELSYSC